VPGPTAAPNSSLLADYKVLATDPRRVGKSAASVLHSTVSQIAFHSKYDRAHKITVVTPIQKVTKRLN